MNMKSYILRKEGVEIMETKNITEKNTYTSGNVTYITDKIFSGNPQNDLREKLLKLILGHEDKSQV